MKFYNSAWRSFHETKRDALKSLGPAAEHLVKYYTIIDLYSTVE